MVHILGRPGGGGGGGGEDETGFNWWIRWWRRMEPSTSRIISTITNNHQEFKDMLVVLLEISRWKTVVALVVQVDMMVNLSSGGGGGGGGAGSKFWTLLEHMVLVVAELYFWFIHGSPNALMGVSRIRLKVVGKLWWNWKKRIKICGGTGSAGGDELRVPNSYTITSPGGGPGGARV